MILHTEFVSQGEDDSGACDDGVEGLATAEMARGIQAGSALVGNVSKAEETDFETLVDAVVTRKRKTSTEYAGRVTTNSRAFPKDAAAAAAAVVAVVAVVVVAVADAVAAAACSLRRAFRILHNLSDAPRPDFVS